jgi:hypothetical protein
VGSLIEVDEGGFWLIDIDLWTLWRHRNRRITVEGMRCGFNELCVRRLKRA